MSLFYRLRGVCAALALAHALAPALAPTFASPLAWALPAQAEPAPEASPDALMYALEALGRAEFGKAQQLASQVLAARPEDTLAATIAGAARYWQGDRAKGREELSAVAARDPAHLTSRLWLGAIFLLEADAPGLARILDELTTLAPRDGRVVVLQSLAAVSACQPKLAEGPALALALQGRQSPLEGLRLAQLFAWLARPAAARLSLEQSLEADPRQAAALVDLGAALFRENRLDLALNAFRQALQLDRDDPKARLFLRYALWNRALEHETAARPDQAVLALREILALAPRDGQALARLRALEAGQAP